jgi:hypothetical protein
VCTTEFLCKKELEQGMVPEEKNKTRIEMRMLNALQKLWKRSAEMGEYRDKQPV